MGRARALGARCRSRGFFLAVTLAAGNLDFIQGFDDDFFRNAVDGNVERTLGFPVVSAAGEFDMEGFTMQRHLEFVWRVTFG